MSPKRAKQQHLSDDRRSELIELHHSGSTNAELAKRFGVRYHYIGYVLRTAGIYERGTRKDVHDRKAKRDRKILELGLTGDYDLRDISKIVGITHEYVGALLTEMGVPSQARRELRNARMFELWDTGELTIEDLAKRFRLSILTLYQVFNHNGRSLRRGNIAVIREKAEELVASEQYSRAEIARMLGITVEVIKEIAGELKRQMVCSNCGKQFERHYNSTSLCLDCRTASNLLNPPGLWRQCRDCGIRFAEKWKGHNKRDRKYCSLRCTGNARIRKYIPRNRVIRQRLNAAESKVELAEIATELSAVYGLSRQSILNVRYAEEEELAPLGWSSDVAVLRMNSFETTRARTNALRAARLWRKEHESKESEQ